MNAGKSYCWRVYIILYLFICEIHLYSKLTNNRHMNFITWKLECYIDCSIKYLVLLINSHLLGSVVSRERRGGRGGGEGNVSNLVYRTLCVVGWIPFLLLDCSISLKSFLITPIRCNNIPNIFIQWLYAAIYFLNKLWDVFQAHVAMERCVCGCRHVGLFLLHIALQDMVCYWKYHPGNFITPARDLLVRFPNG